MSRITESTNVTLTSEAVAPRIVIVWNPVSNVGHVQFEVQRMESIDGVFNRLIPEQDLFLDLNDLMARTVTVGGNAIPPMLVMGFIKQLFDDLYIERTAPVMPDPVPPAP